MRKGKKLKLKKPQLIGLIVGAVIILLSLIFLKNTDLFYLIFGIALFIAGFPFFLLLILESNSTKEKEEMFLEFCRSLVESAKTGTPINKSILNIKTKNFGILNPYIEKLSNQISLGIPVKIAFETFARDLNIKNITQAVMIISESEKAGGKIEDILEAVSKSVSQMSVLKKERKATIYTLVVQGYIIFLVFILIMLIMQFKILPITANLGDTMASGSSGGGISGNFGGLMNFSSQKLSPEELTKPFLWLLVVQGVFTGLIIGKLSEGKIRYGFKHSFILTIIALVINSSVKLFLIKP